MKRGQECDPLARVPFGPSTALCYFTDEHNTAFVDMMSSSGKITRAPPLEFESLCQLSVIMRVIEVKKRGLSIYDHLL